MPVPVPRHSKPYAHPVLKPHNRISAQSRQDQDTFSVPNKGSSPSFVPGEIWLPAWTRTLPSSCDKVSAYPPVQDFFPELTFSGDTAVIKGVHSETYIPPMHNLLQDHDVSAAVRDFMACKPSAGTLHPNNSVFTTTDQARSSSQHLWTKEEYYLTACGHHASQLSTRGDAADCFTPILEDHSPGSASGPDTGSSPLEPLTPFTDFVNRAVSTAQPDARLEDPGLDVAPCYQKEQIAQEIPHVPTFPSIADVPKQQEQVTSTSPTAAPGYRKLVEPLSEWIANYVWRVCTTGYSLPLAFQQTSLNATRHAAETPSHLAPCVQSILLATLLQPSAIYLSLWYMVRLPVYFGASPLGAELAKAAAFQAAFLDEREANEHDAPLRLIVLGFMLANKWLDDHTFSNKTWHTISNIPVQTLNALESRAIDTFSYDLSISNEEWSQWLGHVMSHHISLMSPGRPQPISRPSSNPHTIVRRAIEEIVQTPVAPKSATGVPQPVFLGLEERLREKEAAMAVDVLEIDLDEDGPLREEYLPKRRASKITSQNTCHVVNAVDSISVAPVALLPPPAKWSPAGDEPIHRERNRSSGQYVAVQAPRLASCAPVYPLQTHDATYNQNWLHDVSYMPAKHIGFAYEIPTFFHLGQPTYNSVTENTAMALPHLRSQSLSYGQDCMGTRMRSQSGFGYRFDDIRMVVSDHSIPISEMDARWADKPHYPYSGPAYLPVCLHPSW